MEQQCYGAVVRWSGRAVQFNCARAVQFDRAVLLVTQSCELTHMTKNARYSAERCSFEQVTLNAIQIYPFG